MTRSRREPAALSSDAQDARNEDNPANATIRTRELDRNISIGTDRVGLSQIHSTSPHIRPTFTAISLAAMKVWACLLAGLIAGSATPCAVAGDENDRGTYNNKMALLGFLLESAQQRAGGDVQTFAC